MTDPIEYTAGRIAEYLHKWKPEENVDAIRYGASYYLNYYGVMIVTLIIGLCTGHFLNSVLALLSFGILRRYTGGFHLGTLTICAACTIFLLSLISCLSVSANVGQTMNLIAMVLVIVFGRKGPDKYMALMLIASNLLYGSAIIATCFVTQAATLIRIRR